MATQEKKCLEPRFITPDTVLALGYNIYLLLREPSIPYLSDSARLAVEEFQRLFTAVEDPTHSAYFAECMTIANSLAGGIRRRKHTRKQQLDAASANLSRKQKRFAESTRTQEFLRGAWQILLTGGVAYLLVHLFFSYQIISESPSTSGKIAALAFATAMAFIGGSIKAKISGNQQDRFTQEYLAAGRTADAEYSRGAEQEYRIAAQSAEALYKRYLGEDPPITAITHTLIHLAMINSDEDVRL